MLLQTWFSVPNKSCFLLVVSFLVLHGEGAVASGRFVSCTVAPYTCVRALLVLLMLTRAVAVTKYIKGPGPAEPCSLFMCVLLGVLLLRW